VINTTEVSGITAESRRTSTADLVDPGNPRSRRPDQYASETELISAVNRRRRASDRCWAALLVTNAQQVVEQQQSSSRRWHRTHQLAPFHIDICIPATSRSSRATT
jgi:hypothetical protein